MPGEPLEVWKWSKSMSMVKVPAAGNFSRRGISSSSCHPLRFPDSQPESHWPPELQGGLDCPCNCAAASVKEVAASPDCAPVAFTLYCATNQLGSWNSSRMLPFSSAVTSTLRLQVLPASSLTKMLTDSPGCQLDPVRTTVPPGG